MRNKVFLLTVLNFLFLFFVSILILSFIFFYPYYSQASYEDVTVLNNTDIGRFGFGSIKVNMLFFILKLIFISISTSFLYLKVIYKSQKYISLLIVTSVNLFLYSVFNDYWNWVVYPFGRFSLFNIIVVLSLFFLFWFLVVNSKKFSLK
ncbi:hypothetical protein IX38_16160 [Chryseobacterium luteum]|uniref:Uncharacterized protein n=1 Tax=Chryseobacterium luteum TaxID=421531 RepID=A0A085ZC62_9FLAO|nr:hypothetical protein IX38_16160 [Chryseobacterium luteum]